MKSKLAVGLYCIAVSLAVLLGMTKSGAANIFRGLSSKSVAETEKGNTSTITAYDAEDRSALQLFGKLTHATSKGPASMNPEWNSWKTKCEVGLKSSCDNPTIHDRAHTDFFSMEYPSQVIGLFEHAGHNFNEQNLILASYARTPQLASVLFNRYAADSIQDHHLGEKAKLDLEVAKLDHPMKLGATRALPENTFDDRKGKESIIVKLIWELVPNDSSTPLRVYDHLMQPADPITYKLPPVANWSPNTQIDFNENHSCPEALTSTDNLIPIQCLYTFPIHKGDSQAIQQLSAEFRNVVTGMPALVKAQDVYAVLMGVHIMRKTRQNPNWEWMTFYWTRDNNGQSGWKNPWRHFEVVSTNQLREELSASQANHRNCYNPYLEGQLEPNGTHTNCLSCHSFAAYEKSNPGKVGTGTDSAHGLKEFTAGQRGGLESQYFVNSIQTGFVWSISTNQNQDNSKQRGRFFEALETYLKTEYNAHEMKK